LPSSLLSSEKLQSLRSQTDLLCSKFCSLKQFLLQNQSTSFCLASFCQKIIAVLEVFACSHVYTKFYILFNTSCLLISFILSKLLSFEVHAFSMVLPEARRFIMLFILSLDTNTAIVVWSLMLYKSSLTDSCFLSESTQLYIYEWSVVVI